MTPGKDSRTLIFYRYLELAASDEMALGSIFPPSLSVRGLYVRLFTKPVTVSGLAQWKRAGLITQRSVDRNHYPLYFLFLLDQNSFDQNTSKRI